MLANSGHVMGIISDVAFSFMVHEPREIMDVFRDKSRACSLYRYLRAGGQGGWPTGGGNEGKDD